MRQRLPLVPRSRTYSCAALSEARTIRRLTASQQTALSLDHLVGCGEDGLRHSQTERFRGVEINVELERCRQLHREFIRLGAVQHSVDVGRRGFKRLGHVGTVGY